MDGLQFLQSVSKPGFILLHLSRHEDETIKHHALTKYRYVFQRFFEDNVDVTVHIRYVRICGPPKVQPFGIELYEKLIGQPLSKGQSITW